MRKTQLKRRKRYETHLRQNCDLVYFDHHDLTNIPCDHWYCVPQLIAKLVAATVFDYLRIPGFSRNQS